MLANQSYKQFASIVKQSPTVDRSKSTLTNQKVGFFVPKSEREFRVNDVRGSHFTLGTHNKQQAKSIYETTNKYYTKGQAMPDQTSPAEKYKFAKEQASMAPPNFDGKTKISLKYNVNNFDPNVHKGAGDTHGSVSTFQRFHTKEQSFGSRATDLEAHMIEKKRISDNKVYNKSSHIILSMDKNEDQFKSMNVQNMENSKKGLSLNPEESQIQGLQRMRNELQVQQTLIKQNQKMSKVSLDATKKFDSYMGLQTSSQDHYNKVFDPNAPDAEQPGIKNSVYLKNQENKYKNFKLAYREYENPFHTYKNQSANKSFAAQAKQEVERVSPLRQQAKLVEELTSKNNVNRKVNHNIYAGGRSPIDKNFDYKTSQYLQNEKINKSSSKIDVTFRKEAREFNDNSSPDRFFSIENNSQKLPQIPMSLNRQSQKVLEQAASNQVQPFLEKDLITSENLNLVNNAPDWAPTQPEKLQIKDSDRTLIKRDTNQRSLDTGMTYKVSTMQLYDKRDKRNQKQIRSRDPSPNDYQNDSIKNYQSEFKDRFDKNSLKQGGLLKKVPAGADKEFDSNSKRGLAEDIHAKALATHSVVGQAGKQRPTEYRISPLKVMQKKYEQSGSGVINEYQAQSNLNTDYFTQMLTMPKRSLEIGSAQYENSRFATDAGPNKKSSFQTRAQSFQAIKSMQQVDPLANSNSYGTIAIGGKNSINEPKDKKLTSDLSYPKIRGSLSKSTLRNQSISKLDRAYNPQARDSSKGVRLEKIKRDKSPSQFSQVLGQVKKEKNFQTSNQYNLVWIQPKASKLEH